MQIASLPRYATLAPWRHGRLKLKIASLRSWLAICADYHAAARQYEQLAGLADAELARRGLSRDTLARDLCAALDRHDAPLSRT
jgi:hypothetical protein